ncbi:phytoene desaturase family protein [Pseudofulvibacter geojedonensis]|uniref:Phytoene desaturase family protein n=1 Tax=Pseudofulvibacter geojedonensis TaxID=1123758 RepID=A0ABW3I393_9FLAO
MKKVSIIGSGFSSIAASCYLAKYGFDVTVYEKNDSIGGRARQLKKDGFTFDMGPTWYWMPDVFEKFFSDFNKKPSDYYLLNKLNPAYSVYFDVQDYITIVDNLEEIATTFDEIEKGSGKKLKKFINQAQNNYEIAIKDLVYKPGESIFELVTPKTVGKLNQFLSTVSKDVRKVFKNKRLQSILEFPVLFLGAKPSNTPSFYNFMNYADFGLGTWHPKGGMYEVVNGMLSLAKSLGVEFKVNSDVQKIAVVKNKTVGIWVNDYLIKSDIVLSGADYAHTEKLLPESKRQYNDSYWNKKTFAPSSLLFYVGLNKPIKNVDHHTLFFDTDFDEHASSIYDVPEWPQKPLFYASFPSKTDNSVAPEGKEAAIFLIPLAPGINDSDNIRKVYFEKIINRLEVLTKQKIQKDILFVESFGVNDFVNDYNSYKGNAYGLANTLLQTAFLRPKLKSKKVEGMYFTGQLTVPGPGVPPSLISGKLSAELIKKYELN